MALNDIYQVRLESNLLGEEMLNVFYYRQTTADLGNLSEELENEFHTEVLDNIKSVTSSAVIFTGITVINGMNNADNFIHTFTEAGLASANVAPSFLAMAFRRRTGSIGFRYSYKRFAGVPIGAIGGNGWLNLGGTFYGSMNSLSDALGDVLNGAIADYEPVQITGGFVLGVPPVFKQVLTGSWQINDIISHQDTRQQYEWKDDLS